MKVCVNMPSHVCIAAQAQGEFASRGHATKEPAKYLLFYRQPPVSRLTKPLRRTAFSVNLLRRISMPWLAPSGRRGVGFAVATIMRLGYLTNTRARSANGGDALALGSPGRRVSSAFENDFSSGCAPTGLSD